MQVGSQILKAKGFPTLNFDQIAYKNTAEHAVPFLIKMNKPKPHKNYLFIFLNPFSLHNRAI